MSRYSCCSFFNHFVPVVVMTHYRSTHCQRVRSPTNVCYLNHILATARNFMFVFWFNLLIFPLICNLHKLAIWYKTELPAGPFWCSNLHQQHQLVSLLIRAQIYTFVKRNLVSDWNACIAYSNMILQTLVKFMNCVS